MCFPPLHTECFLDHPVLQVHPQTQNGHTISKCVHTDHICGRQPFCVDIVMNRSKYLHTTLTHIDISVYIYILWIGDSFRYICVPCWYRNDLFSTTTTKEGAQLRHWRLFSRGTCSDTWAKGAAVATPWLWKDNGYIRGNISHTVV